MSFQRRHRRFSLRIKHLNLQQLWPMQPCAETPKITANWPEVLICTKRIVVQLVAFLKTASNFQQQIGRVSLSATRWVRPLTRRSVVLRYMLLNVVLLVLPFMCISFKNEQILLSALLRSHFWSPTFTMSSARSFRVLHRRTMLVVAQLAS